MIFYDILIEQPDPEARSLALSLELYIKGNLSVFAHHTNVDTTKRFVIYDIRDLGKQLRTLGMLIVLDQIWNRITENRALGKHTYIYIDEIQLLFSNEYASNYFFSSCGVVAVSGVLYQPVLPRTSKPCCSPMRHVVCSPTATTS